MSIAKEIKNKKTEKLWYLECMKAERYKKMNWFTFTLMNVSYISVVQSQKFHGKN